MCIRDRNRKSPDLKIAKLLYVGRINPEKGIVVEDAHVGIEAGLAAKMRVIAVATTHQLDQLGRAHLAVESLEQVKIKDLYELIG